MTNTTLTAIPGFRVGQWSDPIGRTGCTVILPPAEGAVASASFIGPSPGTREGILLGAEKMVERIHGLLLTGGSAFGLGAAQGVMETLEAQDIGYETGVARVPIVPAAVIFDLGNGSSRARPDAAAGVYATQQASDEPVARGAVGAGTGATVGKYLGGSFPGGLGSAVIEKKGIQVGAIAVVNAVGDILDEQGGLLAGPGSLLSAVREGRPTPGVVENTTLIAVATAHTLTKAECRRYADAAQTALARVITPSHTFWDGDSAFMLSSCLLPPADPLLMGALVQEAVCAAVRDAVRMGARDHAKGQKP